MIDLNSFSAIQSNLFVKIVLPNETLLLSDLNAGFTIGSDNYVGLGRFVSITPTSSEIRVSGDEISIAISGIPNSEITNVTNSRIKGSRVEVRRVLFDAADGSFLNIPGNPIGVFNGYVNNYTLSEDFDAAQRISSNVILLTCSSIVSVLENKVAGRKTNPSSQKKFFPQDLSMDRVLNLESTTFNFGDK